jgi:hypothetical protein
MPTTAEGWHGLLAVLSNEELKQYRQLALDQVRREARKWWLNGSMLLVAVSSGGWGLAALYQGGLWPRWLWALTLAGAASYWPWRSRKTERLWEGHAKAVENEMARRDGTAAGLRAEDGSRSDG